MDRFRTALSHVLTVSHDDLKQSLVEAEKIRRQKKMKPGPKPRHSSASDHASDSGA